LEPIVASFGRETSMVLRDAMESTTCAKRTAARIGRRSG
jgi:hypothetical protein